MLIFNKCVRSQSYTQDLSEVYPVPAVSDVIISMKNENMKMKTKKTKKTKKNRKNRKEKEKKTALESRTQYTSMIVVLPLSSSQSSLNKALV